MHDIKYDSPQIKIHKHFFSINTLIIIILLLKVKWGKLKLIFCSTQSNRSEANTCMYHARLLQLDKIFNDYNYIYLTIGILMITIRIASQILSKESLEL